jgi:hypothetical protein
MVVFVFLFLDKRSPAPGSINMQPNIVVITDVHAQSKPPHEGGSKMQKHTNHITTTSTKAYIGHQAILIRSFLHLSRRIMFVSKVGSRASLHKSLQLLTFVTTLPNTAKHSVQARPRPSLKTEFIPQGP